MSDDLRNLVLGLAAAAVCVALGWFARSYLWRRRLQRKQRFFGLPKDSECLLVVPRDPGSRGWSVARHDAFALLELAAVIKECGAHAEVLAHDTAWQGFGARTEFCIGGPAENLRLGAHLRSMLPGVEINADPTPGPDQGAITVGGDTYKLEKGAVEYVLLARLAAAGDTGNDRPVFLSSGQRGIANQAAVRYLARHHGRLARKHGVDSTFCLLLRVVNSQAYGSDVVELVADVTKQASATSKKFSQRDRSPAT
ncbi:hypothetical protein [Actinacidiphila bryophytorum]|uniref:Secreted protein n=1 Tax=Actinacidiphila bryophytorum TaxID=1436133 RepID=A0A9W4H606_9ACTN|nr:hypothetical protein [Actinacidiphila bryophytorum]MBM9438540.1 hypothetical protein [Actinacidiphila bryophytorum]MBN6547848.1 hypothetical protein [Actinacidiphila bryophytorum]CAG7653492.1 conserved hypothetical protein [Actinacidiphila bryophytorum]